MTHIESTPPPVIPSLQVLRAHFASDTAAELRPLRNPHHEPKVSEDVRRNARPAAVLLPLVERADGIYMVLTRRTRDIRFAGHLCFPGGGSDPGDRTSLDTALREATEETGLDPARVEILGRMGEYCTQSGYRISPWVGLLLHPVVLRANPREVEEILEVPLGRVLCADAYRLERQRPGRGHWAFIHGRVRVAGPTVSLMIGLYEELLRSTRANRLPPHGNPAGGSAGS